MIDREVEKLQKRVNELEKRIIPDLERKTERLYMQIIPLKKGSEERETLEAEYAVESKELRLRSDELVRTRQQIKSLELQKKRKR